MAKVEMYTKMGCPYCMRARKLLSGKGVEFEDIDITMGGPKRQEMLSRSPGHSTVPSIFIDGKACWRVGRACCARCQGRAGPAAGRLNTDAWLPFSR